VVLKGRGCAAQKAALQVVVKAASVVPQAVRATNRKVLQKESVHAVLLTAQVVPAVLGVLKAGVPACLVTPRKCSSAWTLTPMAASLKRNTSRPPRRCVR
jgi:hypothetical protein